MNILRILLIVSFVFNLAPINAQNDIDRSETLSFPEAEGFGKFATGARGYVKPEVYIVTNLNDSGKGSFRDGVSKPGRFLIFVVSGIIKLKSAVTVAPNTTIAGQTAPGKGIIIYGRKVSFTGSDNTIVRHIRIRLGSEEVVSRPDASGIANGKNMIFDHVSFSWGQDEVFSISWDKRGTEPHNITIQNCIIGQGLHLHNHSAGGLIQTTEGHISILKSLYISNKTRNPKVKGYNEFVNNVIYNWGNAANPHGHSVSGDAYIMGGSAGISKVNIINNYFIAGPATPEKETPFSRGTGTFYLFASGNMFDADKDGNLNGKPVPLNQSGYPGIDVANFMKNAFPYPYSKNVLTATEAFNEVIKNAGATLPVRDEVDAVMINEARSLGKSGQMIYKETDLELANGGLGMFKQAQPLTDSDKDGIPDNAEKKMGLNPKDPSDALQFSRKDKKYLNIEVYINSLDSKN